MPNLLHPAPEVDAGSIEIAKILQQLKRTYAILAFLLVLGEAFSWDVARPSHYSNSMVTRLSCDERVLGSYKQKKASRTNAF